MPDVARPSCTVHYRDEGTGAPPLVLLHGWCDDGDVWTPILAELAPHHRCLVPDMRGHGRSGVPNDHAFFPAALTGDVTAIAAAAGVDRPVVIGHSYGGILAAELVRRFPAFARAVVIVDQHFDLADQVAGMRAQGLEATVRGTDTHLAFRQALKQSLLPPGTSQAVVDTVLAKSAATSVAVGLALWAPILDQTVEELAAWDLGLQTALARVPALVLEREESPAYETRLRAAAPAADVRVMPGSHWMHLEQPRAFATIVRDFVRGLTPSRPS